MVYFSDYDLDNWHKYEVCGDKILIDGKAYKIMKADKDGIWVFKL